MILLPARTLPTPWQDPLVTAAQARQLIRQPGFFLFIIENAHILASVQPQSPADIITLFTPPELRRRGLARQLLAAVVHQAKAASAPAITLEVRATNAAAIALYQNYGFTQRHTRRGYYSDPTEDALVMQLNLSA